MQHLPTPHCSKSPVRVGGMVVFEVALLIRHAEGAQFPTTLIQLERQRYYDSVCPTEKAIRRPHANQYVAAGTQPNRIIRARHAWLERRKRSRAEQGWPNPCLQSREIKSYTHRVIACRSALPQGRRHQQELQPAPP